LHLAKLMIDPSARRQGVASSLLNKVLNKARITGFEKIFASCESTNKQMKGFLEKNGFRLIEDLVSVIPKDGGRSFSSYRKYLEKKVIINLACTGMVSTKEMNFNVPITPEEIIDDVSLCRKIGASIAHIHARDINGVPTWDPEVFKKIIEGIREKTNNKIVICATTSGRNFSEFEKRSAVLDLEGLAKPEMASLTLGSANFPKQVNANSPQMIQQLVSKMKDKGIVPELEIFEPGMIHYAKFLIERGFIEPPFYFNIILGLLGTAFADINNIACIVNQLPEDSYWTLGGIGKFQLAMNTLGLTEGNGARVGLEDNLYFTNEGSILATNALLVERIANLSRLLGHECCTADDVRTMLKIGRR